MTTRVTGAFLLLLPLALAAVEPSADPAVFRTVIRKGGDDGVHTYRIPGLATTPKGTLIAVFDIRHRNGGDLPGDIDVGMMRSTDDGATWSPMRPIIDYDAAVPGSQGNGVGDPCVLVDRQTGTVLVAGLWSQGKRAWNGSGPGLTPEETGQLVIVASHDDGLTWDRPVNITTQVKKREWKLLFQGPGAGIQQQDGTLVMPAQFKDQQGPHSCFIHSRDHGATWAIVPPPIPAAPPTSEAQIAEMADGSLVLGMRNESRKGLRAWSRWTWNATHDGGAWSEPWFALTDPTCMASLIRHPQGLLLSSNPDDAKKRVRLTVRASSDQGRTWNAGRILDERGCMYSCMSVLRNGDIGILYEVGPGLTFARFPLAWALQAPAAAHP